MYVHRWLQGGKGQEVQPEIDYLDAKGVLDVVTPGVWTEFRIGKQSGMGDDEDDDRL